MSGYDLLYHLHVAMITHGLSGRECVLLSHLLLRSVANPTISTTLTDLSAAIAADKSNVAKILKHLQECLLIEYHYEQQVGEGRAPILRIRVKLGSRNLLDIAAKERACSPQAHRTPISPAP